MRPKSSGPHHLPDGTARTILCKAHDTPESRASQKADGEQRRAESHALLEMWRDAADGAGGDAP